jgi:hypothetical protein
MPKGIDGGERVGLVMDMDMGGMDVSFDFDCRGGFSIGEERGVDHSRNTPRKRWNFNRNHDEPGQEEEKLEKTNETQPRRCHASLVVLLCCFVG